MGQEVDQLVLMMVQKYLKPFVDRHRERHDVVGTSPLRHGSLDSSQRGSFARRTLFMGFDEISLTFHTHMRDNGGGSACIRYPPIADFRDNAMIMRDARRRSLVLENH